MALFEVAVLLIPTESEKKDGMGEQLLVGPKAVVAKDEKMAILTVGTDPALVGSPADRMRVLVRPFCP